MNKIKFIMHTQFKEMVKNWRFNIIVLSSLIFSFIFVIIFVGKIIMISDTKKLANLKNISNSVLVSTGDDTFTKKLNDIVQELDYDAVSQIVTKEITFTFQDKEHDENLSIIDHEVNYFHRIQGLDTNKLIEHKLAISEYLARKYHIGLGDSVTILGEKFEIISVFRSYEFEKRMLISREFLSEKMASNITLNNQYFLHLTNKENVKKFEQLQNSNNLPNEIVLLSLKQKNNLSMSSLNGYIIFVCAFSLVFILLSLTNCLLVFEGKLMNLLKNIAIKKLCGLKNKDVILGLISENNILCLISLHISLLIVLFLNPYLPLFFAYTLQWKSYFLALVVVLAMMSMYSMLLYLKLDKYDLINLLKGEV